MVNFFLIDYNYVAWQWHGLLSNPLSKDTLQINHGYYDWKIGLVKVQFRTGDTFTNRNWLSYVNLSIYSLISLQHEGVIASHKFAGEDILSKNCKQ